jgi:hypothetical protein
MMLWNVMNCMYNKKYKQAHPNHMLQKKDLCKKETANKGVTPCKRARRAKHQSMLKLPGQLNQTASVRKGSVSWHFIENVPAVTADVSPPEMGRSGSARA